jgi:hypothetical protein
MAMKRRLRLHHSKIDKVVTRSNIFTNEDYTVLIIAGSKMPKIEEGYLYPHEYVIEGRTMSVVFEHRLQFKTKDIRVYHSLEPTVKCELLINLNE